MTLPQLYSGLFSPLRMRFPLNAMNAGNISYGWYIEKVVRGLSE